MVLTATSTTLEGLEPGSSATPYGTSDLSPTGAPDRLTTQRQLNGIAYAAEAAGESPDQTEVDPTQDTEVEAVPPPPPSQPATGEEEAFVPTPSREGGVALLLDPDLPDLRFVSLDLYAQIHPERMTPDGTFDRNAESQALQEIILSNIGVSTLPNGEFDLEYISATASLLWGVLDAGSWEEDLEESRRENAVIRDAFYHNIGLNGVASAPPAPDGTSAEASQNS